MNNKAEILQADARIKAICGSRPIPSIERRVELVTASLVSHSDKPIEYSHVRDVIRNNE